MAEQLMTWNDGAAKDAILDFIDRTYAADSP